MQQICFILNAKRKIFFKVYLGVIKILTIKSVIPFIVVTNL